MANDMLKQLCLCVVTADWKLDVIMPAMGMSSLPIAIAHCRDPISDWWSRAM